jgi:hypothetical protein
MSAPVLTSFIVTEEQARQDLSDAIAADVFGQPKYIVSYELEERAREIGCLSEIYQTLSLSNLALLAKEFMTVNIGTRIGLLQETLYHEEVGLIRRAVGLVRMGRPLLWRVMDVYWLENEPCPFLFQYLKDSKVSC